jgi:regulator of RNase E activity RraA
MKPVVKPEDKDVERLSNLPIAVISDAMDKLGLGSSALDPAICRRTGAKIAGRARTIDRAVKPANITQQEVDADLLSAPQKLIDEAIRGDVSVAVIGDNMSTRALCRGVAGVVIDGAMRDVDAIREMGLGVYARSLGCRSALGRLVTMGLNTPIICGGVWVRPGDVVIGDADGVIVIPQARAAEVADLAEKLEVAENQSKTFIEAGNSLVDAVKKYKVT